MVAEDGALHLDIKLIECKMAKQSDAHLEKAMAQIKNGLRVLTKVFRPKGSVSQSSDNGFFLGGRSSRHAVLVFAVASHDCQQREHRQSQGQNVGPKFWMSPEAINRKLGSGDEITKASDVYQLAAVFWFAATGRHPTGIVSQSDWRGPDSFYEILSLALSHSPSLRPKDGAEFHQMIEDAVLHV